ncbi:MAG TPA: hypothetical protein VHX60_06850 [Acidobacteriaceae bacterium]|jgi:hypothetical protein|nr:hypothetical protein [Acidobacteriaceae bacterium]
MITPLPTLSYLANILGFVIAMPITAAAWHQAIRARQEVRRSRDVVIHSENCLEFVSPDGACVNLIPLETLRALPRPGDVVLLPGTGIAAGSTGTGAYRIERVEHIYTRAHHKSARPQEARLTKAMAHVVSLHETPSHGDITRSELSV